MRWHGLILSLIAGALAACGKGNAPSPTAVGPTSTAASTAATRSAPHFSELRRGNTKDIADPMMSALTGELIAVPKDLPGRGPERDAFFAQHHLDVMIYSSEPNFTFQLVGVDKVGFVQSMDEADWQTLDAAGCMEAIRAARDEDTIHRDGIACEPGKPVYFLFETARGVRGMGHAVNEKNELQVETKLVWGG